MKYLTQKHWVEGVLSENGYITRNHCLRNYVSRLGAIIDKLKREGWEFEAEYFPVVVPFGDGNGRDYKYRVTKIPEYARKEIEKRSEG